MRIYANGAWTHSYGNSGGGILGIGAKDADQTAIANSIAEEATTIDDVYEPYLLQTGLLKRTTRGRMVTEKGIEHIKSMENK